ncbi:MAG: hypothetical protein EZS28_052277, partial [Streblomastix strix]
APMSTKWALSAADNLLREIKGKKNVPFGGIVTILGGDFRQVLPVVIGGGKAEQLAESIKKSLSINEDVLKIIQGEQRTFIGVDKLISDNFSDKVSFSDEYLSSLTPNGLPPSQLTLKQGAIVMLLRNLDVRKGL